MSTMRLHLNITFMYGSILVQLYSRCNPNDHSLSGIFLVHYTNSDIFCIPLMKQEYFCSVSQPNTTHIKHDSLRDIEFETRVSNFIFQILLICLYMPMNILATACIRLSQIAEFLLIIIVALHNSEEQGKDFHAHVHTQEFLSLKNPYQ
jgi:hypothetical protein